MRNTRAQASSLTSLDFNTGTLRRASLPSRPTQPTLRRGDSERLSISDLVSASPLYNPATKVPHGKDQPAAPGQASKDLSVGIRMGSDYGED
jgi:hypothetical protein